MADERHFWHLRAVQVQDLHALIHELVANFFGERSTAEALQALCE